MPVPEHLVKRKFQLEASVTSYISILSIFIVLALQVLAVPGCKVLGILSMGITTSPDNNDGRILLFPSHFKTTLVRCRSLRSFLEERFPDNFQEQG